MKTLKIISALIFLLILSTNTFAQHQHKAHLDSLVTHYLSAKEALANDNFEGAHQHLARLKTEATSSAEMNHHPEHAEMHAKHHGAMVAAVTEAEQAENLDQLRAAFHKVSQNLIKAVRNQGYDETLHIQYCPMASNGEGASWMSSSKEIANPYMGQKMPSCGTTQDTL
ncbi:DUF3347 domain-containing protein [Halalkalibaculum sp. DA3122]|uniref:DUF3347 domain-containing protein n=1 Tax=Halalkalibaculum sp. DA3122 TaxID=3373607 RepID=UPI0037548378